MMIKSLAQIVQGGQTARLPTTLGATTSSVGLNDIQPHLLLPSVPGRHCIPMSSILHGSILPSPNQELRQPSTGDEISIRVPMHAARFFSPFFPSYHLISLPNDISEVSPTPTLPLLSLHVLLLSALKLSPVDTPHSFCTHLHSRSLIETEELALSTTSAGSSILRDNVDWKERFRPFQPSLRHIAQSTTDAKSTAVSLMRSSLVYTSLD